MHRVSKCLLAATVALAAGAASATERLAFGLDVRNGLPASRVLALAQDTRGFVWIGTEAGLARYDGVEVRPWDPGGLRRVSLLASGANGLIAGWGGDRLYEIEGAAARPLTGPDGSPFEGVRDAVFDARGGLWVVSSEGLFERRASGEWRDVASDTPGFAGQVAHRLDFGAGAVHALTASGVWRLESQGARQVVDRPGLQVLEVLDDGTIWTAEFCCRVFRTGGGRTEVRFDATDRSPLRAISMASRSGVVWLSFDRLLVGLRDDGVAEVLDSRDGIRGGGPLLIDDEASLWLGTESGVTRYPEPESAMWTDGDGLPRAFESLARTGNTLWVSGWDGIGRLDLEPGRSEASRVLDLMASYPFCTDARDRLWIGGLLDPYGPRRGNVVAEQAGGGFRVHRRPDLGNNLALAACTSAPDGTAWVALGSRLMRTSPDGGPPTPVFDLAQSATDFGYGLRGLLHDSSGSLWMTDGERVCSAPAASIRSGRPDGVRCDVPSGTGEIFALHEAAPGEVWIATRDAAVLSTSGDGWHAPFPDGALPTTWVQGLAPSRDGGVWLLGDGLIQRASRDAGAWSIVERLGSWSGVPALQATAALEESDGTLWLASHGGVVRVPIVARREPPRPPRIEIVAATVDDRPLAAEAPIRLPYARNRLEVKYAGLSFRDPESLRYRVRHRADAPWSPTRNTVLRWVDLAPGDYAVEVQASLDGRTWSASPARFVFSVQKPWYGQAWFLALAVAGVGLVLYAGYRLRVTYLLGIERERSRIAVDLHDDMGSKLGSIGLLADLAAGDALQEERRQALLGRISQLAGEVGGSLADIVWALRPGSMTLELLAAHLAERGEELLKPREIRLTTAFPEDWPAVRLGLGVRRHVQLIGIEALHNAARHSGASRVELSLFPDGAGKWKLRIEDDGNASGEAAADSSRGSGGVGLGSMRQRAERIGAELDWILREAGGCRVELRFDPRAEDRRFQRYRPFRGATDSGDRQAGRGG